MSWGVSASAWVAWPWIWAPRGVWASCDELAVDLVIGLQQGALGIERG